MTDHFKGRQFNQSVITFAVGYYLRYNISYRDLVEMMRDRGIFVHHTTLMRWLQHYSPIMRALWRKRHRSTSKSWRMDETYIKINGITSTVTLMIKVLRLIFNCARSVTLTRPIIFSNAF